MASTDGDIFVSRFYALPRREVANLATVLVDRARLGDPDATAIVDDAADRLAATLISLRPGAGPTVLGGGLLCSVPEFRAAVQSRPARRLGRPVVVGASGAVGAAWPAARTVAGRVLRTRPAGLSQVDHSTADG